MEAATARLRALAAAQLKNTSLMLVSAAPHGARLTRTWSNQ
jgi:hypothetical protein